MGFNGPIDIELYEDLIEVIDGGRDNVIAGRAPKGINFGRRHDGTS